MTARKTTPLAVRKELARKALEAEAAAMALAAGYDPADQAEAIAALLADPVVPQQAISVAEFCAEWGHSVSTFKRKHALNRGLTPPVKDVMGHPRILRDDIVAWKASLKEVPAKPLPPGRARPASAKDSGQVQRARKVKAPPPPAAKVDRRRRPSIFDLPPAAPKVKHLKVVTP